MPAPPPASRLAIAGQHRVQAVGRAAPHALQRLGHRRAMSRKPMRRCQERGHRHLVGSVQDRRGAAAGTQGVRGPAAAPGSAPGPAPRSRAARSSSRSSRARRRGEALRPGQRVRDRRPHVGRAELGQHRAVDDIRPGCGPPTAGGSAPRSAPPAWRTDRRPRSPRGPCSSWWRSRPRSWRPSTSSDAPPPAPASRRAISRAIGAAERPARGGQDQPLDRGRGRCRPAPGRSRCARNRPAAACAAARRAPRASAARRRRPGSPCWPARPWRRAGRPPASAQARPRRRSPPSPTRRARRRLDHRLGPGRRLDRRCRPARRAARRSAAGSAITASRAPRARACSASRRRCGRRSVPPRP